MAYYISLILLKFDIVTNPNDSSCNVISYPTVYFYKNIVKHFFKSIPFNSFSSLSYNNDICYY